MGIVWAVSKALRFDTVCKQNNFDIMGYILESPMTCYSANFQRESVYSKNTKFRHQFVLAPLIFSLQPD